ncbi:hypothetical protein L5515_016474 [Caenorhabditis briggsae]|uniref:Uncharacterized protein n=1 Tax=Caenorhabditis briggsae TaxID=6238 RepID=A0AAE9FBM2_CAEBR|nr:hypothetical protein L5515_016474 [Caenorhabditis briggsae]
MEVAMKKIQLRFSPEDTEKSSKAEGESGTNQGHSGIHSNRPESISSATDRLYDRSPIKEKLQNVHHLNKSFVGGDSITKEYQPRNSGRRPPEIWRCTLRSEADKSFLSSHQRKSAQI